MSVLAGRSVLVTAGGTREPIDAVRFLGNRSSGRMGVALAAEARRRGADVTLISANLSVEPPAGVEVVEASTAAELGRETLRRADSDVVLMTAGVADYRPASQIEGKRGKDDRPWQLELEPTEDILRALTAKTANGRVVVGFAAETGADGLERARTKRTSKKVDLLVYNDVGDPDIGFESSENEVVILSDEGERHVRRAPKERIAAEILDDVERVLRRHGGATD